MKGASKGSSGRAKLCKFLEVDYVYGMGILGCKKVFIDGKGEEIKSRNIAERECRNCRHYEPTESPLEQTADDNKKSSGGRLCQKDLL